MKRISLTVLLFLLVITLHAAGSRENDNLKTVDVGYMPILPVSQAFIIEGKGWNRDSGIAYNMVRFSNGPAMVQALASGDLDVVYFGIGPAMVARSKGIRIKVVASNIVEQIAFIGREEVSAVWNETDPGASFGEFEKAAGRKMKIATFPQGSVPDTVLRYWIIEQLGLTTDAVQIIPMGSSQVQQALLSGSVDAAAILEPVLTIVQDRDPEAKVLARAPQMFPGQPGAVLAVREELIADSPETVQILVNLHIKATEFLEEHPEESAEIITSFIGKGLVDSAVILRALQSPSTNFLSDPAEIIEPSRRMHDFQLAVESLKTAVDLEALFETRFYEAAR